MFNVYGAFHVYIKAQHTKYISEIIIWAFFESNLIANKNEFESFSLRNGIMCDVPKKYITSNYILKRIKERKAFCFGQLKGEINLMKRNPFTMKRLKG